MKEQEKKGSDKISHILRSICHQPNHLKSKKVKELLKEEKDIDLQIRLTGSLK